MSDCGCKGGSKTANQENELSIVEDKATLPIRIIRFSVRLIGFILSLIIIPFIVFFTILMLWHHIVLDKKIDAIDLFLAIGKKMKSLGQSEDKEDDYEGDYTDGEYELTDVEVEK